MKSVKSRLRVIALGLGMLGAASMANAASVPLTDQEMEGVTAAGASYSLLNIGVIAVSTAQAVSTPYFSFVIGLNAGMNAGLNNNGLYWQLSITR